ncbi:MAG: ribonuclease HII [Oscillospiraceae bacterium]|jgi:ribonuclease HII|nr:ribonuclease HII [Oscillospiraceae bacterium]
MKTEKNENINWWQTENALFDEGWSIICGVDEAGRGPLAGPVFAAAVILPRGLLIAGLDDSKKLTPKKRERLYDEIREFATAYAIASASPLEIDELNILNATYLAMNRAIAALDIPPELAVIDGNRATGIAVANRTLVGGDGKSAQIAAASVLAKVARDRLMLQLAEQYPGYGFERHKGYGTDAHYAALRELGACDIHRRSFLRKLY